MSSEEEEEEEEKEEEEEEKARCCVVWGWGANLRESVSRPVMAAVAAMAGLTRCVLPPRPCRPSKLRLDVEAHRSLAPRRSWWWWWW